MNSFQQTRRIARSSFLLAASTLILRVWNSLVLSIPLPILKYPPKIRFLVLFQTVNRTRFYKGRNHTQFQPLPLPSLDFSITTSSPNDQWLLQSVDSEISHLPRRAYFLRLESNQKHLPISTWQQSPQLLLEWIDFHLPSIITDTRRNPYITSDSVSNILLYLYATSASLDIKCPRITEYIYEAALSLIHQIEYQGPLSTCNHLLNNVRALYLSSLVIPSLMPREHLTILLDDALARTFKSSYYFREGSFHYQLIITSWLHHILSFAFLKGHSSIYAMLQPYYFANLSACRAFNRLVEPPLIGDLSPDCAVSDLLFYTRLDYYEILDRSHIIIKK